jgi:thiopeptide-type bacteriocin biosynthesis protein
MVYDMNDQNKWRGVFLNKVVIRSPYFSVSDYKNGDLNMALQNNEFRQAIWLASPDFYDELEKAEFCLNRLDTRKQLALRRYFNRACFRPTPFGAFASFSLADWSSTAGIRFNGITPVLHLLPACELQAIQHKLRGQTRDYKVRLNPLLYRQGTEFRFITSFPDGDSLSFGMNSLPAETFNLDLINLLQPCEESILELTRWVRNHAHCTQDEAVNYLDFLIDEQVLITERELDLVEPLHGRDYRAWEQTFRAKWSKLPFSPQISLPMIRNEVNSLMIAANDLPRRALFYSALERPVVRGGVNPTDQDQIHQALDVLKRLAKPARLSVFKEFMLAFKSRFDREKVSLLNALDPDHGISYGKSLKEIGDLLLDDINFAEEAPERHPRWTEVHELLLQKWLSRNGADATEPLTINDEELGKLPERAGKEEKWSPSLFVLYRKSGERLYLESTGGATAAALIGRFSVFSDEVAELAQQIAMAEQEANPSVIFAEISHFSGAHIDNVNRRRQIYEYVIPLTGFSDIPASNQLAPSDLLLSVHGEELILESCRLGKRIIPRLPTAYNYHHNELPLFRFLCDLQLQYTQSDLSFDLEFFLPGLNFYPRVEYRKVILNLAYWKLSSEDVTELTRKPFSLGRLHVYRQNRHLPVQIKMGTGDQQLVFDLSNDAEAYFFLECLKPGQLTTIQEYLQPDDGLYDTRSLREAEYLAFLINPETVYRPLINTGSLPGSARRTYPPGSEWLYLKIFCTPASSDTLLTRVISPFIQQSCVKSWFFIRYTEGGYHLRVRLQGDASELTMLLPSIQQSLDEQQMGSLIRDIQLDSYKRELERYSGEIIELVERIFAAGSNWVLFALQRLEGLIPFLNHQMAIFPLITLMMSSFFDNPQTEEECYNSLSDGFISVMSKDKSLRVDMDKKYRKLKGQLNEILNPEFLEELATIPDTQNLLKAIRVLSVQTISWSSEKRRALIADVAHMQVNRHFRSRQLHYEALTYYCLTKHTYAQRASIADLASQP